MQYNIDNVGIYNERDRMSENLRCIYDQLDDVKDKIKSLIIVNLSLMAVIIALSLYLVAA